MLLLPPLWAPFVRTVWFVLPPVVGLAAVALWKMVDPAIPAPGGKKAKGASVPGPCLLRRT